MPSNFNSDTQFITSIMGQYDAYKSDAKYDPLSRDGYNSNNLATSFLVNSGVTNLPWHGNAPGIDPGYGQVIPGNYLKANGRIASSGLGALGSYSAQQGLNATGSAIQRTLTALRDTLSQLLSLLSNR